ncbi:MAG: glycoside hydrolase family 97 protein, partial [Bacteroidota bacterium]
MDRKITPIVFLAALLFLLNACTSSITEKSLVQSPHQHLTFTIGKDHQKLWYRLFKYDTLLIDTSYLDLSFGEMEFSLGEAEIVDIVHTSVDSTWEQPWGEQRIVRDLHNSMLMRFEHENGFHFAIHVKAFNDGVAFRYEFADNQPVESVTLLEEKTQFAITDNPICWWIPGDWDIYEHLYKKSRLNDIDATAYRNPPLAQSYIPYNAVNTPITLKRDDGIHMSLHEANLTNYPGMTLRIDSTYQGFISELVGNDEGIKGNLKFPFHTPWRMIQVTNKATDLVDSRTILNLNEPNKLGDVSWFSPMKYAGIWWDMHLDRRSWGYAGGRHGATTEYAKELIDFAASNNIDGMLVEGWNTGWEHWTDPDQREGIFDFVTPYPDYNLKEVASYAREKGVQLIMHHETSAAPRTYEQQLDTAYKLMESLGIHAVKTGYVGQILPNGEYHHGQWMVNHYRKVLMKAAEHKVAVNAHEPIKATGIRRTYPNAISREGLRGQEFNAWSADGGNPPSHIPTVAFTRMLAGPIDYTPGIFHLSLDPYKPNNQVNTTLAHQLALYVVIYSPIQMVPDLIEHYKNHPAFEFIRKVPVDWEQSTTFAGEVGQFIGIARQERGTENWYVGAITNEEPRSIACPLPFLADGTYKAILYQDAPGAHYQKKPQAYVIDTLTVSS